MKLHITAQSGTILIILLLELYLITKRGSNILITKTSDQTRQRGHTLSTVLISSALPASFLLSRSCWSTSADPKLSRLKFFSPSALLIVHLVFHIASITNRLLGFHGTSWPLLRPPQSCPSSLVPGLWSRHDAMMLWCHGRAGASGLIVLTVAVATGYSLASPPL